MVAPSHRAVRKLTELHTKNENCSGLKPLVAGLQGDQLGKTLGYEALQFEIFACGGIVVRGPIAVEYPNGVGCIQ